jgi:methyl-accepting chemotaxis protein
LSPKNSIAIFPLGFNMKSISVKAALTTAFAVLLAVVVGIGYVAISKMSGINENVESFAKNYLPSVTAITVLTNTVNDLRMVEGEHLISSDPAEKTKKEGELADHQTNFTQRSAAYEKLIDDDVERKLYDTFRTKWTAYQQQHARLAQFSRDHQNDQAFRLYNDEMGAAFDSLRADLRSLRELNSQRAGQEAKDAEADYAATISETSIAVGIGIVFALAAMAYSFFGVSRPIEQITGAMTVLSKGDTTKPIPFGDRKNEIGSMAGAVQVFKDNMIRARELEKEAEAAKARAEADRKRDMGQMADQFERAVGGIVTAVSNAATELQSAAQALASSASETTHQSTIVAAASEQASANVRTVAAAAEELSGSVREISRQVSESANMASKAVNEAEQTTSQVSGLSAGAQKIGAIVDLINDIASKTNLLALNATIEAARAGEAGRGFAVVASEVKALAEQTSKATAEITGHIGAVQSSTDQAANAIIGIGKTIDDINHIASTIAAAVEEQGAATEEIARNVDQASQGTTEVTRNITGVNRAAETSSASASQVLSSATELAKQSERLRAEMQKFLVTVRAA